jgi:hypothetical protein
MRREKKGVSEKKKGDMRNGAESDTAAEVGIDGEEAMDVDARSSPVCAWCKLQSTNADIVINVAVRK